MEMEEKAFRLGICDLVTLYLYILLEMDSVSVVSRGVVSV